MLIVLEWFNADHRKHPTQYLERGDLQDVKSTSYPNPCLVVHLVLQSSWRIYLVSARIMIKLYTACDIN